MVPDFVSQRQRRKLFLAPRGSFKTACVTSFIIWLLVTYPQIKILLYRAQRDAAQQMLREIKQHLVTNEALIRDYGDLSKDPKTRDKQGEMKTVTKWDETEIIIGTRVVTVGERDPSVGTAGIDVSTTGTHPDIILADDVVVRENCDSVASMRKAKEWMQSCYPLLPPWGTVIVTGTMWSNIDLYAWILEENSKQRDKGEQPAFSEYIRSVYYTDGNGQQQLYFPERLSQEFIDEQQRVISERYFEAWYFNRMVSPRMKPFKREHIIFFEADYHPQPYHAIQLTEEKYHKEEVPLWVAFMVDPALTASASSDSFGMVVIGFDANSNWVVLESREVRELPSEAGDHIIELLQTYQPDMLIIESANADSGMLARIGAYLQGRKDFHTSVIGYSALQDEKKGTRGKAQRIGATEPLFRAGRIWVRKGYNNELIRQFDLYPGLEHDDVIDAFAMGRKAFDLSPRPEKIKAYALDDGLEKPDSWLEHIHALNPQEKPSGMEGVPNGAYTGQSTQRLPA